MVPWGNLHNRDNLINPVAGLKHEVHFDHDQNPSVDEVILESNHTHFLLVDSGHKKGDLTQMMEQFQRKLLGLFKVSQRFVICAREK